MTLDIVSNKKGIGFSRQMPLNLMGFLKPMDISHTTHSNKFFLFLS